MTGVNVSGALPEGDGNGLNAIIRDMMEEPKKLHVAIVILDVKKITRDTDTGQAVPTARLRRIEVLDNDEDRKVAERLMRRALDKRTGREALPYDLEVEIQDAFENAEQELDNNDPDD